jgi:hypothetical protein
MLPDVVRVSFKSLFWFLCLWFSVHVPDLVQHFFHSLKKTREVKDQGVHQPVHNWWCLRHSP